MTIMLEQHARSRRVCLTTAITALLVLSADAAGPTFRPDVIFKGSSLTGWNVRGEADWKAQNGEIIGTPKSPDGGWLVLNQSFQDVDIILAKTSISVKFNGGSLGAAGGTVEDQVGKYGPIALYVGGTGEARFKDVAYSDLNARPFEPEKLSSMAATPAMASAPCT